MNGDKAIRSAFRVAAELDMIASHAVETGAGHKRCLVSPEALQKLARTLRSGLIQTGHNPAQTPLPLALEPVAEPEPDTAFDGVTYDPALDHDRVKKQLGRVYEVLATNNGCWPDYWVTLRAIANVTGDPESSVSARLRDLRKPKHGGHNIEARRRGEGGTWEYRLQAENTTAPREERTTPGAAATSHF